MLAKNEIDYGERAVTIIDTPDGGAYNCALSINMARKIKCVSVGTEGADISKQWTMVS